MSRSRLWRTIWTLLLSGLVACRPGAKNQTGAFPRNQTLYIGGVQWSAPASFNPLLSAPDWPVTLRVNLLYESLFVFDSLSGKMEPLLGKSCQIGDGEFEVTLDPAARFNDGHPVTGWDVKYTFELGRRFKSLNVTPLWNYLAEIRLPEEGSLPPGGYPRKVVFVLNPERKNPLVMLDELQRQRILPRHVLEPMFAAAHDEINQFNKLKFDENPVGSGPYRLHSFSNEKIALVRDDHYWGNAVFFGGKQAGPKYVVHPIYKSNDHFSIALQQGRLDISSAFMPRIWLKRKKGVHSWYDKEPFFVSSVMPMLFVNVTRRPLSDVHIRRAMAFSINYKDIRELAVSGYSEPLKPGLILPFGIESKYYSEEDAQQYGASRYDPRRALSELRAGGYRSLFNEQGELLEMRDGQGKKVSTVYIKSPAGWSDWESIVRIVVKSLRAVGIDARERFVDAGSYFPSVYTGDFDLALFTPSPEPSPSKPWSRLESVMTSNDWVAPGQKMYKNMGRFNNPNAPDYVPRVDQLLRSIPTLTGDALVDAYRELNRLFMRLQPTLPLVYRPESFFEYSDRVWQGFPNAEHPFLPPQLPGERMGTRILWHLRPNQ